MTRSVDIRPEYDLNSIYQNLIMAPISFSHLSFPISCCEGGPGVEMTGLTLGALQHRGGVGVLRDWKGGLGVGVGGRTSRQMGSQWISARISFLTNEQGALLGCKLLSSSSFSLKQFS